MGIPISAESVCDEAFGITKAKNQLPERVLQLRHFEFSINVRLCWSGLLKDHSPVMIAWFQEVT